MSFKRWLFIGQKRFIFVNFVKGMLGVCIYQYIPSSLIELMSTGARAIGFEYLSKLAGAPTVTLLVTGLVLLIQLYSLRFTKTQSAADQSQGSLRDRLCISSNEPLPQIRKQIYMPMLSGIIAACVIGYVGLPAAAMYIIPSIGVDIVSKMITNKIFHAVYAAVIAAEMLGPEKERIVFKEEKNINWSKHLVEAMEYNFKTVVGLRPPVIYLEDSISYNKTTGMYEGTRSWS